MKKKSTNATINVRGVEVLVIRQMQTLTARTAKQLEGGSE